MIHNDLKRYTTSRKYPTVATGIHRENIDAETKEELRRAEKPLWMGTVEIISSAEEAENEYTAAMTVAAVMGLEKTWGPSYRLHGTFAYGNGSTQFVTTKGSADGAPQSAVNDFGRAKVEKDVVQRVTRLLTETRKAPDCQPRIEAAFDALVAEFIQQNRRRLELRETRRA